VSALAAPLVDVYDYALVETLGPDPVSVAVLIRSIEGDRRLTRARRRNVTDRLVRLEGKLGIVSVWREGRRLWARHGELTLIKPSEETWGTGAVGTCARNAKYCYPTQEAAEKVRRSIVALGHYKAHKRPRRSYECPWCSCWHLTSKTATRGENR
jgi:hypothetical protein